MKRSERLRLVERVAQQHEDKAAKALKMAEQKISFEQQQLEQLVTYQQTYQNTQKQAGSQGIGVQQYLVYQHFLDQIEVMIANQQRVVNQAQQQYQQLMRHWQQLYLRRRSMAQLAEKVSLSEFMEQQKAEQKAIDEIVNQMQARQ
ncbi:flagellar export protein FliJ [Salinibius halmophilus]|uniref:flagellar export protein FliJ n=1 Tax=Salinibius halmophilus TaxID=1853216 RepID=UPI000E664774|nr:flagellar export protein FliJ [Salinibius halmophilus]